MLTIKIVIGILSWLVIISSEVLILFLNKHKNKRLAIINTFCNNLRKNFIEYENVKIPKVFKKINIILAIFCLFVYGLLSINIKDIVIPSFIISKYFILGLFIVVFIIFVIIIIIIFGVFISLFDYNKRIEKEQL